MQFKSILLIVSLAVLANTCSAGGNGGSAGGNGGGKKSGRSSGSTNPGRQEALRRENSNVGGRPTYR